MRLLPTLINSTQLFITNIIMNRLLLSPRYEYTYPHTLAAIKPETKTFYKRQNNK